MNALSWLLIIICLSLLSFCLRYWNRLKSLKGAIEAIADTSFDLTGSSEQIASVSKDLKSASDEQLDTLSTIISAGHEIDSMINRTNENAKELLSEADQLKTMSIKGSEIIQEMVSSSHGKRMKLSKNNLF